MNGQVKVSISLLSLGAILAISSISQSAGAVPVPVEDFTANANWLQSLPVPPLLTPENYFPDLPPQVRLVIRLGDRRVYLYHGEQMQKSYPIAIGKQGWETPTGTFAIRQKLVDPSWQHPFTGEVIPPGNNNPLGRRWIGFWTDGTNVIGFHGTPNENSVGRAASHGCIRMLNADVASLFEQVDVGTPVIVEP